MTRVRAALRLLAVASAALAVSLVPVARAFADLQPVPSPSAAMSPARPAGSSAHLAHRMPRLRRPKQSLFALPPESSLRSIAASSARRRVPRRERPARAASFADLLDHPPA
ncbi:MAG TPA: hypothetical protein VN915_14300 [Elusimicrobiota bacterium]|nr:hypothetical protein [Elusimicrobiota bacterium]